MRAFQTALLAFPAGVVVGILCTLGLGFALDGPVPPLERSDAIIVISGDEDLARMREGIRLYRQEWGNKLIFSGASRDEFASNAEVMRRLAVDAGVPEEDILVDHEGADTFGNAQHTLRLMREHGFRSAILVTSPYHLRRATLTFQAVYESSGIRVIGHAAPDSQWRKLTWFTKPETRQLTLLELGKLGYILVTGQYR